MMRKWNASSLWISSLLLALELTQITLALTQTTHASPPVVFSQTVSLPFVGTYDAASTQNKLRRAFHGIVDSSDFLQETEGSCRALEATCSVPVFGDSVRVSLRQSSSSHSATKPEFLLVVDNAECEGDFGWICAKFYEKRDTLGSVLSLEELKQVVISHFDAQPPHPGYDAANSPSSGLPQTLQLLAGKSILKDLDENGYVVVDSAPKTSELQHQQMSTFLELKAEKTNQGDHVRRDSVHFLARKEAISCGLEEQYELLMSIASHLNDNLNFRPSDHEAVFPGTNDKPLTNPALIQLAEYNQGGFYVAHSDNSLSCSDGDDPTIRTSFRHYTCILYCNEDWTANSMGGALRLYPGSRDCLKPIDATTRLDYLDVNPINGRLLIFDSCLVHSVDEVTQSRQARRALTLWINRPDDSGVRGERFF